MHWENWGALLTLEAILVYLFDFVSNVAVIHLLVRDLRYSKLGALKTSEL